jgi:MerC mercury resistance protein
MTGRVETTDTITARRIDWATALPAACAVHCALTPLAVLALPFVAISTKAEAVLLGLAVVLASVSLSATWHSHGRVSVFGLAALGALIWGLSLGGLFEPLPETLTDGIGGMVLAAALFWNGRLRHESVCGDLPHHARLS